MAATPLTTRPPTTTPDQAWWHDVVCPQTDPDAFFAENGHSSEAILAKKVCARCPTKAQCLAEALQNNLPGIWGGTSEQERRRMRATTDPHDK